STSGVGGCCGRGCCRRAEPRRTPVIAVDGRRNRASQCALPHPVPDYCSSASHLISHVSLTPWRGEPPPAELATALTVLAWRMSISNCGITECRLSWMRVRNAAKGGEHG